MEKAIVLNIQRFSPHDGEGIRTTIFFKGCGLHCTWCHNPESQSYKKEVMVFEERCKQCGYCIEHCERNALREEEGKIVVDREKCVMCGDCVENCPYSALEMAGEYYTTDEIVTEAKKDMIIYDESNGGVTLSGGEVMSQNIDFLIELCEKLDRHGIRVNIDTCGLAPAESYRKIVRYIDTFLYDIKTINEEIHRNYIGDGLEKILDNLKIVNDLGGSINIRMPIIGGVNDSDLEIDEVLGWLIDNKISVKQINLLPYHNTGSGKYDRIGKEYKGKKLEIPSDDTMERIKNKFVDSGFNNIFIGG